MRTDDKIALLQKFFRNNITDQELKSLFVWLNSEKGILEYEQLVNERWLSDEFEIIKNTDPGALFSKIQNKINVKKKVGKRQLWIGLRNAAAFFILGLLIPVTYFTLQSPQKTEKQIVYHRESISNEKVRKITLSDGTTVWLLSGSSITYPSNFEGNKTRNVEIKGEAFFNVSKDSLHPFIVNLGEIGLRVVGTSFNVMNYGDEDHISVVLKTGSVNLFKGEYSPDKQFVNIVPGQMVTYEKENPKFLISNVDVDKYTSWINETLLFRNDPLADVLKKLGRWYNVRLEINAAEISVFPFTATVKNESLDQIVDLLKFSTPFKYSILKANGETKLKVDKE